MTASPNSRTQDIKAFIDQEHFRFVRNPSARRSSSEIEITDTWGLILEAPRTPLTTQMIKDFRTFCETCEKISLREAPAGSSQPRIVWRLSAEAATSRTQLDPAVESFTLKVEPDLIEISAAHERGLLHGTHRFEWLMADRGGPFLEPQTMPFQPAFMPRISNGMFISGHPNLLSPGDFSDPYLSLMSHYGVNGIHLWVDLHDIFRSTALPELNAPNPGAYLESLRTFGERTRAHGIDLYLLFACSPYDENHAIFSAHPECCGARVELFVEGYSGRRWYNLCSGNEKVRAAYAETIETFLTAAPEIPGCIFCIGGESFYHCFTRPADAKNGETTCPHCLGKSASTEVASLTNVLAAAVKKTGADKSVYAWTYSAFIWSAHDPHQLEWIRQLDPAISVLSNFDCGDEVRDGVRCFDYNITCVGPSRLFTDQAEALRAQNRPIFTKTETNTTPEAFFIPYLPVHTRWQARFESMRRTGVAGFIGQWRFLGMNGSPPEELQYRATWEEIPAGSKWLQNIAQRDFKLGPQEAAIAVEGWQHLGEAWDYFPYSAMTCGERGAYMRGPFYLGPSHPLIFDVQDNYGLPLSFRLLRGDLAEMLSSEEIREMQETAKPRYVSDLLLTLPYGVDRYLELLVKCRALWSEGVAQLQRALSPANDRARLELDVCETVDSHLTTLENVVRFYVARDRLHQPGMNVEAFREEIENMRTICQIEMQNAERMLPVLDRNPRIGWGHSYGPVYDATMVRAKIEQCRHVREIELPRFSSLVRFHVWLDSP